MQLEVWVFAEFSSHVFKWQGGLCITMARLHFLNNGKTTQFPDSNQIHGNPSEVFAYLVRAEGRKWWATRSN